MLERWFPTFFAHSTQLSVRDALARYRRLLIAALVALIFLSTVSVIRDARPVTSAVVVTHAVPAGAVLTNNDLQVASVPRVAGAGAASQIADVVGRTLLVALNDQQPVFASFTMSPTTIPRGTAAVPLRTADVAVSHIVRAGERVDVVGTRFADAPATLLARNVMVLTVTTPATTGLLKSSTDTPLIVVLADSYTATRLAAASLIAPVAVTLRS